MSRPVWYRCLGGVAAPLALRYTTDSGRCQKVSLLGVVWQPAAHCPVVLRCPAVSAGYFSPPLLHIILYLSVTQGGAGSPPPLVEVNQAILAWSFYKYKYKSLISSGKPVIRSGLLSVNTVRYRVQWINGLTGLVAVLWIVDFNRYRRLCTLSLLTSIINEETRLLL